MTLGITREVRSRIGKSLLRVVIYKNVDEIIDLYIKCKSCGRIYFEHYSDWLTSEYSCICKSCRGRPLSEVQSETRLRRKTHKTLPAREGFQIHHIIPLSICRRARVSGWSYNRINLCYLTPLEHDWVHNKIKVLPKDTYHPRYWLMALKALVSFARKGEDVLELQEAVKRLRECEGWL